MLTSNNFAAVVAAYGSYRFDEPEDLTTNSAINDSDLETLLSAPLSIILTSVFHSHSHLFATCLTSPVLGAVTLQP